MSTVTLKWGHVGDRRLTVGDSVQISAKGYVSKVESDLIDVGGGESLPGEFSVTFHLLEIRVDDRAYASNTESQHD